MTFLELKTLILSQIAEMPAALRSESRMSEGGFGESFVQVIAQSGALTNSYVTIQTRARGLTGRRPTEAAFAVTIASTISTPAANLARSLALRPTPIPAGVQAFLTFIQNVGTKSFWVTNTGQLHGADFTFEDITSFMKLTSDTELVALIERARQEEEARRRAARAEAERAERERREAAARAAAEAAKALEEAAEAELKVMLAKRRKPSKRSENFKKISAVIDGGKLKTAKVTSDEKNGFFLVTLPNKVSLRLSATDDGILFSNIDVASDDIANVLNALGTING